MRMRLKEIELWKVQGDGGFIIVESKDIIQRVSFFETNAYMFDHNIDIDLLRKVLVEYKERKEDDKYLSFYEVLDEYNITYDVAGDEEDYDPNIILCFPDDEDIEWAICAMGDLEGVSDVYRYWDGHNWREIWAEMEVVHRIKLVIDEDTKESLDEWDGSNFYYRYKFNHASLYRIISIDDELVEDKYLLWEWTQWQGSLDEGTIINVKDIDKLKSWSEESYERV